MCVCVWNFSKEVKPAPALLQQRTSMYLFINDFVDIPRATATASCVVDVFVFLFVMALCDIAMAYLFIYLRAGI